MEPNFSYMTKISVINQRNEKHSPQGDLKEIKIKKRVWHIGNLATPYTQKSNCLKKKITCTFSLHRSLLQTNWQKSDSQH